jgi:hypothetical protein
MKILVSLFLILVGSTVFAQNLPSSIGDFHLNQTMTVDEVGPASIAKVLKSVLDSDCFTGELIKSLLAEQAVGIKVKSIGVVKETYSIFHNRSSVTVRVIFDDQTEAPLLNCDY